MPSLGFLSPDNGRTEEGGYGWGKLVREATPIVLQSLSITVRVGIWFCSVCPSPLPAAGNKKTPHKMPGIRGESLTNQSYNEKNLLAELEGSIKVRGPDGWSDRCGAHRPEQQAV